MRPHHVRRRNRLAARVLQIVEIHAPLLALGQRARHREQIGPLGGYQARQHFRHSARLFIAVDGLERHIDVHAVAARRFRISREAQQLEPPPHQQRRLHDLVVAALVRIEVDQHEVRMVQRIHPAHPRVLIDAANLHQVQQLRSPGADHLRLLFAIHIHHAPRAHPIGKPLRRVLLKKRLRADAVGISLEVERAVHPVRDQQIRHGIVVVDHVALVVGLLVPVRRRKVDLAHVSETQRVALDGHFWILAFGIDERRTRSPLGASLPHALRRIDIGAHADEHRRAQLQVVGPGIESHSANQLGLHPLHRSQQFGRHLERATLRLERRHQPMDRLEQLVIEARAYAPYIDEPPFVENAQHQRAEIVALANQVARDDELLLGIDLDLHPVTAAPR